MESPICVVDAETLIDHIHVLKRWIYNGQLRVVVPSMTYEHVQQIHPKSKEAKPASKEAPRPKSSGKPVKKEYPTFDINPLLARHFLLRLKTWDGAEGLSEQRDFFREKENHEAVSFQRPSEQYTPWKDVEIEEEKPQVAEDRPTTWAEALRRKQNSASGTGGAPQVQKGPAKPKLVAKNAGSEPSPWKMKKDAPKISAKDLPGTLRPLMSCALWRLHESIDRNDANELFLLSNQAETRKVAQKLNIIVRSPEELGVLIEAKAKRVDVEVYGDVEREFGVQRKASKQASLGHAPQNGENGSLEDTTNAVMKSGSDTENDRPGREGTVRDGSPEISDNLKATTKVPLGNSDDPKTFRKEDQVAEEQGIIIKSIGTEDNVSATSRIDVHPRGADMQLQTLGNGNRPGLLPVILPSSGLSSDIHSTEGARSSSHSITRSRNETTAKDTLTASSALPVKDTESDKPLSDNKPLTPDSSPATSAAVAPASQPKEAAQEPEDSDEEVVVFVPQPKRFSNQKKQIQQQNSRPSTPITQPHNKVLDHSSKSSSVTVKDPPKPPGRGRNPHIINHGHPQPTSAPVVIDPDAFGRSFAVNPSPSPRNIPKPRSHHHLRRSVENNQSSQNSHHANHTTSRTSPPRQFLHNKSPRLSPAPETRPARGQSTHSHPVARTSPQRKSKTLASKDLTLLGHDSSHASPVVQPQPKSLSVRMVESQEFVPRSTFTEPPQFGAVGTPLNKPEAQTSVPKSANPVRKPSTTPEFRLVDPNSFVPRDFEPVNYSKARAMQARAVDADDFVPRSPTPKVHNVRSTPEPEIIEPRASMPDVQYVLKSGSTRAATRGRGRLWVPT